MVMVGQNSIHADTRRSGCDSSGLKEKNYCDINPSEYGAETKTLTLLLVEDDLLSSEMLLMRIENLFSSVFTAADGDEGFQLFCEHKPDIVLTDQVMPRLSGLDLMRKIRAIDSKTPVILMTSSIDSQILQDAINTGIERFVPKPVDYALLLRTFTSIAREMLNDRLQERHHKQEVELLRYRDAYNSLQQESAQRKERHVIRHDLSNQILKGADGVRWGIDVLFSPRDIMCGDGYSVRNLVDGRQLIFIVDGMGSGMSASLTALLTTSFCNYQIGYPHPKEAFTLSLFIKRFHDYLSSTLLEEEVVSCGFLLLDLVQQEIESALFALPPMLLRGVDGSVQRIRGENPPLGIYPCDISISTLSLSGVADLLIMTDGVTDATLVNGGPYQQELPGDFKAAPTLAAMWRRFRQKTDHEDSDDLTLIHLRRLDYESGWKWRVEPDLTLRGLSRAINEFLDALAMEADLHPVARDELESTLTEAMTNALEHGCLCIDRDEKRRLLLVGEYDDTLEKKAPSADAWISLSATLWQGAENPLLLLEMRDSGPGFPDDALSTEADKTSVNGRGLRMINRFNDTFFIGGPGGCLVILKTLEGGNTNAD